MNRIEFQKLTNLRVREAEVLLKNKCYEGAYYLLGYAIECALKACIAKQTKRYDFPDKNFVQGVYTHDLPRLLGLAGLNIKRDKEGKKNPEFDLSWAIVKDWKEDRRYSTKISKEEVEAFHSATLNKKDGVLTWLQKWW